MSAFLVSSIKINSLEWAPEYGVAVPPIVRSHGGVFLGISKPRPGSVELIEGDANVPDSIALLRFPSMDALKSFLEDPRYAPYKQARQAGTESICFAFENDDAAPQLVDSSVDGY